MIKEIWLHLLLTLIVLVAAIIGLITIKTYPTNHYEIVCIQTMLKGILGLIFTYSAFITHFLFLQK